MIKKPNKNVTKDMTYTVAAKLFGIFFVTAILGILIGRWLDVKFDIYPYGRLASFFTAFGLSWIIVYRVYNDTMRFIKRESRKAQEERKQKRKKKLQSN